MLFLLAFMGTVIGGTIHVIKLNDDLRTKENSIVRYQNENYQTEQEFLDILSNKSRIIEDLNKILVDSNRETSKRDDH